MQSQSDRKDSMVNDSHGLESDADHYWQPKYETQDLTLDHPIPFTPTNPFYNSEPAYSQHEATNPVHTSALHHGYWAFDHPAAAGTPVHFDYSPVTDFESSAFHHEQSDRPLPSLTTINQTRDLSDSGPPTGHHIKRPLSPSSTSDWMAFAEQGSHDHAASIPKRMRAFTGRHSSSAADCLRSDMSRKKNTKIDIPSERNLLNIDRLIEESTNELERKELKSQRRLLRNREAALASRQRKKKHTEELENKERDFSSRVRFLENRIDELVAALANAEQDKQHLMQQTIEARNLVEGMHLHRHEMITNHTRETSALRRQLQSLEQKDDAVAPIMSAAPSSSGYNEVTNNMDALSVNGQSWDRFCHTPDQQEMHQQKPYTQHAASQDNQHNPSAALVEPRWSGELPAASSVLFMLLLCGAFVASRSSSNSLLPRLPEEVKAASSTVLQSLLGDDNAATMPCQAPTNQNTFLPAEPASSLQATSWQARAGQTQRRPEHLPRSMTTPVATNEPLFAVMPSEYNSMTGHISFGTSEEAANVPRTFQRNLAEALSTFHTENAAQGNHAEIYNRSLLWDQILTDVVNQFKSMIRESRKGEEGETRGAMHQHPTLV
ncbi:hypothetical protein MBLNU457_g0767t1 [Dothideomycetes sp. NU457]